MKFTYFLGYLFLVNLTGFLAILSDYIRSLFNFRRLPEKRYVFVAFAGGCFGVLAGIYTFKHLLTDNKLGFGMLIGNIPFNMDAGLQLGIYEQNSVLNTLHQGRLW